LRRQSLYPPELSGPKPPGSAIPPAKSETAGSRTKPSRYQPHRGTAARTQGRDASGRSRCPDRKVDRIGTDAREQHPDRSSAVQVRDVMTEATVTESPRDSLRSAAERMWRQQTGSLIIAEGDQLIGIITERDLLRAVALGADPDKTTVDDAMTTQVFTVT